MHLQCNLRSNYFRIEYSDINDENTNLPFLYLDTSSGQSIYFNPDGYLVEADRI